jgi:hypothetical protein
MSGTLAQFAAGGEIGKLPAEFAACGNLAQQRHGAFDALRATSLASLIRICLLHHRSPRETSSPFHIVRHVTRGLMKIDVRGDMVLGGYDGFTAAALRTLQDGGVGGRVE